MTKCWQRNVGSLIYCGRGKKNEDVYILAVGKKPALVLKTLTAMVTLLGEELLNYRFVNCEEHIHKREGKKGIRFRSGLSKYNSIGEMVATVHKGL